MKLRPENGTFILLQWKMVGPTFQTPSGTNFINKKFMIQQKVKYENQIQFKYVDTCENMPNLLAKISGNPLQGIEFGTPGR